MSQIKKVLKNKWFRLGLIVIIVGATFTAFALYIATNPKVISLITSLHPATLTLIAIGYIGTILANALVLTASLQTINKRVPFKENLALTGYSSVVNFFGPLQSGPGFRAAYLKQRHGVSLKKFFSLTVVFYAFFAVINGAIIAGALLLTIDSPAMLATAVVVLLALLIAVVLAVRYIPRVQSALSAVKLNNPFIWVIGLGALLLTLSTTFAYYFELFHVDPSVQIGQTVVYAAAANLALFVSLTPGAIGFRESFLLLTEKLHQIPDNVVIAASIIDRAFYVVFLLVLFLILITVGVRTKLESKAN